MELKLREKLLKIQSELSVPKNQRNSFGNYNYRSCEDILEALKPLLVKYNCIVVIGDSIEQIGDRYYVKAQVTIKDVDSSEEQFVTAYAREEETKKGMDGSQITGASSSYARKYALNGLFGIDDTKDSDTTNKGDKSERENGVKTTNNDEMVREPTNALTVYCDVCNTPMTEFSGISKKTGKPFNAWKCPKDSNHPLRFI